MSRGILGSYFDEQRPYLAPEELLFAGERELTSEELQRISQFLVEPEFPWTMH